MQDSLSGRAAELAHLTDLIRTSLSLADAAIPLINEQLNGLAEMGIDNIELEGPRIYPRRAGWSPAFDDEQIIDAAALALAMFDGPSRPLIDISKSGRQDLNLRPLDPQPLPAGSDSKAWNP
jgi:hypothetical protein